MADDKPLGNRASLIAERCEKLALAISKEAAKIERQDQRLRMINIGVGSVAAIVTISPPIASLIGTTATQSVSLVAAIVLILDGLIPSFRRSPSPDRLRDYAFYVHGYSGALESTLTDSGLSEPQRRSKVVALLGLAEKNLSDVCSKFPEIYHSAIPNNKE